MESPRGWLGSPGGCMGVLDRMNRIDRMGFCILSILFILSDASLGCGFHGDFGLGGASGRQTPLFQVLLLAVYVFNVDGLAQDPSRCQQPGLDGMVGVVVAEGAPTPNDREVCE